MSNADAEERRSPLQGDRPLPNIPGKRLDPAGALDLMSTSAKLLFENGQTTERMVAASEQLAEALGVRATLFPRWGELVLRIEDDAGSRYEIVAAEPAGMDMNKVTATMAAIDKVCDGRMEAAAVRSALEAITRLPPVSIARFVLFAAAGAAALGVIFGAAHLLSLVLIAFSAGAGACLRRWLAGMSHNLFVQPFCAALLAGVVGAARIAVAAYGTFFAMPWRMLPIPILVGMLAHASRWEAIYVAGASAETGALVACLVAGVIITPIADRMRLPFAGLAFASVVSLMPGVFLFRMAGGMVDLVALGSKAPQELFVQVVADGTTAILIILAMSFGLIFLNMFIQYLNGSLFQRRGRT
jgi:uncharacterized membrane protein YjjP (DUF1212 family)